MKILVSYRQAQRINSWETGHFVSSALRDLGHEVTEYGFMYETNQWFCDKDAVLKEHYDLLLWMECGDPSHQYTELRSLKCPKFYWGFDVSYNPHFHKNLCNAMQFDWIFSANVEYQANFFGPQCSWLPYAAYQTKHFRSVNTPKVMDVVLVGSDRPDRRQLISALRRQDINAELISDVFKEAYIDTLASAKIIINQNPEAGKGLLNCRFWETMAAGSCLLTQRSDGEDRVGRENEHFAAYSGSDEAVFKCRFLLEQEDLRLKIALAGQSLVIAGHTYHHRAEAILERFNASNR